MKWLWVVLGLITLVGCAVVLPPKVVYLPDGRRGYSIECSDAMECYEQAGWACGSRGYAVAAARDYGAYSLTILRHQMVIACQ